jgi:hypothetical protein
MSKVNLPVTILGILAMVIAVVGVLFVGQIINPPGAAIAVALVDMPVGTVITRDMVAIDTVHGNPKVAAAHVSGADLDKYVGSVVVEPIHQYSYLPLQSLSVGGNPAAAKRMALALSDPKVVAMVVPVTAATAPDAITEGDHVDLVFGTSGQSHSGKTLTTRPTEASSAFGANENLYGPVTPSPMPVGPTQAGPTGTPTPEPLLELPVAKTIVRQAQVLSVVREQNTSTAVDSTGKSVQTVTPGAMLALVVAVPREAAELLQFAIDNGEVRVSLLSAQVTANATSREPTLGMTWNDLTSLMRMDRQAALDSATQTVMGPGAYAIEATLDARAQASPSASTPQPGASAQATDSATAAPTATPTATQHLVPSPTPKK